jgi:hypothetical protein
LCDDPMRRDVTVEMIQAHNSHSNGAAPAPEQGELAGVAGTSN